MEKGLQIFVDTFACCCLAKASDIHSKRPIHGVSHPGAVVLFYTHKLARSLQHYHHGGYPEISIMYTYHNIYIYWYPKWPEDIQTTITCTELFGCTQWSFEVLLLGTPTCWTIYHSKSFALSHYTWIPCQVRLPTAVLMQHVAQGECELCRQVHRTCLRVQGQFMQVHWRFLRLPGLCNLASTAGNSWVRITWLGPAWGWFTLLCFRLQPQKCLPAVWGCVVGGIFQLPGDFYKSLAASTGV